LSDGRPVVVPCGYFDRASTEGPLRMTCRPYLNDKVTIFRALRPLAWISVLALLSACASQAPQQVSQVQEAQQYASHARGHYTPPGPPGDPWGPYIEQAAKKFDVPQLWIRAVMSVESRDQEMATSPVGAMGLMQVMPETYDEVRGEYGLGEDPYDPYNNIVAGAAYMREMYDIYGTPGFLAAYNAGPHRLDAYLSNEQTLPYETRRYVAMIAPMIEGIYPSRLSPAQNYAMNQLPFDIPPGLRYGRVVQVASRQTARRSRWRPSIRVARAVEPSRRVEQEQVAVASLATPPAPPYRYRGLQLIASANAEPAPDSHGTALRGRWAVQVGAFNRPAEAHAAASRARVEAHAELAAAHSTIASVHAARAILWRARLTGLSREAAVRACAAMARGHKSCIVLSPDSQY
jgi:hypothetical protein